MLEGPHELDGKVAEVGALTVGGAKGDDHGVIPKRSVLRLRPRMEVGTSGWLPFEIVYGQHWYWYTTREF